MTRVQVILDPGDSLQARRIAARAARRRVVVCRATPQAGSMQLARDVLRALGKRFDVADSPRRADRLWARVTTWLRADQVGELIVLRAHLLPYESIMQLLTAAQHEARLTLLVHAATAPPPLEHALANAEAYVEHVDIDRYEADLRHWPLQPPAPPARPRLPTLPRDEFLYFTQACADVLDGEDFNRVCDIVAASRRTTDHWLDGHAAPQNASPARPSKQRVLGFLAALAHCEDSEEALARLRGAQIALLFDDLLVEVDAHAFVAAHAAARASARLDTHASTLLRTYSSPVYAAAGALALASGAGAASLSRLTIAGVAADGGEVSLGGRTVIVPANARALVRAQVIARGADGARPTDAFFTSHRQLEQPASVSALRTMLKHISEQTGLATPDGDATPGSWWIEPARAIRVHEL
jgi:hypothetical protein